MSNSLDPDQTDLGPNRLQRLSAEVINRQREEKNTANLGQYSISFKEVV